MRIVFSRKGFDSAAGGGPSPIVEGRPVSLPIPAGTASRTTYGSLGLGEHALKASRGRLGADDLCHHDPMFLDDGTCLFGQCGSAQTHLENQGVGVGDVFLFFGLFADEHAGEPHHRIFGYMAVAEIFPMADGAPNELVALAHPHALAMHHRNDVIYRGPGAQARSSPPTLRLTAEGGPPSLWSRPAWMAQGMFSYHDREDRWLRAANGQLLLRSVARGQEFVADVGRRQAPRAWLDGILGQISGECQHCSDLLPGFLRDFPYSE